MQLAQTLTRVRGSKNCSLQIADCKFIGDFERHGQCTAVLAMNEIAEALKERSMRFALRLSRFCRSLPETWEGLLSATNSFAAALARPQTITQPAGRDRI